MTVRLIAVDIDGTLLSSRGVVLPGTRAEFARARALGVQVALVSGRPMSGLRGLLRRMKLADADILVGLNGAIAELDDGTPLASHAIDPDVVRRIGALAKEHGVVAMLNSGDELLSEEPDSDWVHFEADNNGMRRVGVPDVAAVTAPVQKILMRSEPAHLKTFSETFIASFGDAVEHAFSVPFYFEATARGVDKGSALVELAAHLGIPVAETLAFGDNHNDLPMLAAAGLGVAMGNSVPEAKAIAGRVTASHDDEGIARVLADLLGGGVPADPVADPEVEPVAPVVT